MIVALSLEVLSRFRVGGNGTSTAMVEKYNIEASLFAMCRHRTCIYMYMYLPPQRPISILDVFPGFRLSFVYRCLLINPLAYGRSGILFTEDTRMCREGCSLVVVVGVVSECGVFNGGVGGRSHWSWSWSWWWGAAERP